MDDLIPQQVIMAIAIIGGLISIALSSISPLCSIFSIVTILLLTVYGTNSLRKIGNYSLGTGVPSIVYMLTAIGLISLITAIFVSNYFDNLVLFPVVAIILSIILGYLFSLICKHLMHIEVAILCNSFIAITLSTTIIMLAMSTFIVSSFNPQLIWDMLLKTGLILLLMIMTVMIIQNPYNSGMGPNEEQYRTLTLAVSNAFLMLIVLSIISIITNDYWYIYLIISIIGWIISFRRYLKYTTQQVALIKWSGLWPQGDEDE